MCVWGVVGVEWEEGGEREIILTEHNIVILLYDV